MLLLLSASMTLSIILIFYSHPVAMMIIILSQAMLVCIMIWMTTQSSWFAFILFLVFLGGLMVLFIYISSLASNEIFKINTSLSLKMIAISSILGGTLVNFLQFEKSTNFLTQALLTKMSIIFSNNIMTSTILIMSYLLLVLVVAVKISSKMEGPIRNFVH